jgi:hypothetical protein
MIVFNQSENSYKNIGGIFNPFIATKASKSEGRIFDRNNKKLTFENRQKLKSILKYFNLNYKVLCFTK